jgi:16S rRNA processing protein RimM
LSTVSIGRVGRPHGIDGSFVVERPSESALVFEPGARLLAAGEEFEVVARKRSGGRLVIKLDRPVPRGCVLELPRDRLPPLEEGSFYVADLIGFDVATEAGERLGAVADVLPGVANDALELDSGRLLPMHEECVLEIDLAGRRILVARGFADGD